MIKRIRFATRKEDVSVEAFSVAWTPAVAAVAYAPHDVRPARVAVCMTVRHLIGPAPKHDGIGIEWFADTEHLGRFEAWLDTPDGKLLSRRTDSVIDHAASPVVVVEESVVRGADWLARRWRDGGEKLKHMAVAVRAAALTRAEFAERWRNHAGTVGNTVIPDDAKGRAYVQNHPLADGGWAYDAVNEVYFDDVADLRTRIGWFHENVGDQAGELFGRSWFLAVREVAVPPALLVCRDQSAVDDDLSSCEDHR